MQGAAQGHGMHGGEAQAAADGRQGGEFGRGREFGHHPVTAANGSATGAGLGRQDGQLRVVLGREACGEIQLRRPAVFDQRHTAEGRLMKAAQDIQDLLQLLRQRRELQQAMVQPLKNLQVGDLQLQLPLAQLQTTQVVVALLFDQPARFGGGQQRLACQLNLQDIAVGQYRWQALTQGLGRLLQCLHRAADPP